MTNVDSQLTASPWPHRFALLLGAATFPLLFIGAMVTTRKAGMAVPDWPTTFGYNMFLYPLASWFAAPWNVFVEHGHRLFAALVGLVTIALLVSLWLRERRHWVVMWGVMLLVLVITQGLVGGKRVTENSTLLAQIHGCLGPLFFATVVAICVFTSRLWQQAQSPLTSQAARRVQVVAWLTTLLAYAQLAVGSQLRHIAAEASPESFRTAVWFHLFLAAAVMVHSVLLLVRVYRLPERLPALRLPAAALLLLVLGQIGLGFATWRLKYGWPDWLPVPQSWIAGWTNSAGTFSQSVVITAHVAVGSLIVGVSLVAALYSVRMLAAPPARAVASHRLLEAAR